MKKPVLFKTFSYAVVPAAEDSTARRGDENRAGITLHRLDVIDATTNCRGADVAPAGVVRPRDCPNVLRRRRGLNGNAATTLRADLWADGRE